MSFSPGMLKGSDAQALNQLLAEFRDLKIRFEAMRPAEQELLPVLLTDYEATSGVYSWQEQTYDEDGNRMDKQNGLTGDANWMPAFMPDNSDIGVTVTNPVQAFIRAFAANGNLGMVWEIVGLSVASGGGGGGGDSNCCGYESNQEYHPTLAPFQTTCDIRRPFGAGAATTSNVSCTLIGNFYPSRLSTDAIDWTHVMVCPAGTDVRDALTRLTGGNALSYADGDEVRIPSGASSPRFVVVFVERVNRGEVGPTYYDYYRVFMMRHTA
jgi:hypothetical protein